MRIHLVAIDVDGTLLNSAKQVTETTSVILRAAREEAGIHIVLATARPPRSVMHIYDLLDLDTPMINYNGALVYDPAALRVLLHRPLAAAIARAIVDQARTLCPEVVISAEVMDQWFTDRFDPAWVTETSRQFRPNVIAPVEQWLHEPVTKLLLLGHPEMLAELGKKIWDAHVHQIQIMQTEGYLLQICHATVSKREALKVVAAELGVRQDQVMAIGDNANDVGMLKWAGVGVAMGNAVPAAIAAADYVTDGHDKDGAANAIHELILKGHVNHRDGK